MKTCKSGLHQYDGKQCLVCKYARLASWRAKNREYAKTASAEWRASNIERAKATRHKYRTENPDTVRASDLRKHGFNTQEINKHFSAVEKGKCEACGHPETALDTEGIRTKRLCFDHNHATGRYRGTLCSSCNTALGFLKESPERFRSLLAYLERALGCQK